MHASAYSAWARKENGTEILVPIVEQHSGRRKQRKWQAGGKTQQHREHQFPISINFNQLPFRFQVFGMVDPFTILVTLSSFFGGFSASHFCPDPLRLVLLLSAHPSCHGGLLSSSGGLSHLGCARVTSRWMMMMMISFSVFILQVQLLVQFLIISISLGLISDCQFAVLEFPSVYDLTGLFS